jgi:hypothetical protein
VGRAIDPLLVIGQVEGGVYMGLGEALMEEQTFRKGLHKWPSMLEYKSPTFVDTPEIETFLVETIDPEGPYGAKEAGQGPLLPVIPAVNAAVYDALGVWVDETPITPEKVLKALKDGRAGPKAFPAVPWPEPIVVEPPDKHDMRVGAELEAAFAGGSGGSSPHRSSGGSPPGRRPGGVTDA